MSDLGPGSYESAPEAEGAEGALRAQVRVDLDAVAANVARLREAAPHSDLMAVVKADAYGHGLLGVARTARAAGARWLGVALLDEALLLREAGDEGRLMAWLSTPGDRFAECIERDVDLSASSTSQLSEISDAARRSRKRARVHLKIDTGLGRSGSSEAAWHGLVSAALKSQDRGELELVGIWSHFAYADSPQHPTIASQLSVFQESIEQARDLGADPHVRHIANSAATLTLPESHYDMVRPGIAVYGISPGPELGTSRQLGLAPAMRLSARLALVKRLPAGHGISYGHQYVTERETTVGLVPLGYADGLQRAASGKAPVLAAGRIRTIAGRVCMDQFVVDLGDDLAREGDEVVVFGSGSGGEPTAEDWAQACGTIAYEIVTCIGPRVARYQIGGR